jgi:putative DNA primase/helicase
LVAYLQRLLGYALTGSVQGNLMVVLWGAGANGKTTLVNTFLALLGEGYAFKAPRDLFMTRKNDTHPTLLASLFGKRFVVGIETQDGSKLDEAMVKEMTGNDPLTARKMR